MVGQLLAFDAKMNLVLAECSEVRIVKSKKGKADDDEEEEEMRRTLGLVILRGDTIVTLAVDGPPPIEDDSKGPQVRLASHATFQRRADLYTTAQIGAGPGMGGPAGRGMGLQAPTM